MWDPTISFYVGKDSTLLLYDIRQKGVDKSFGEFEYDIGVAFLISFGNEIRYDNILGFFEDLIAYAFKTWKFRLCAQTDFMKNLKSSYMRKRKKKKECRAYLQHVEDILFKRPGSGIECDIEYRGHRGDSDYIVTGIGNVSGADLKLAFIWELKAPQSFVFEKDPGSANRLIPSKDLLQAENQLLNYYDELKYSGDFLEEHEITHSQYVFIGGIIIGSNRTQLESILILQNQKKIAITGKL